MFGQLMPLISSGACSVRNAIVRSTPSVHIALTMRRYLLQDRRPCPTSADPRTTRQRSSRKSIDSAGEDIDSAQPDNLKRRRLDLDELMIKPAVPAKPISAKPVELFRQAMRPEITRLAETDPMPPPSANRSLGRGTGKAGRPTITDLIRAREVKADFRASEAALRK